MPNQDNSSEKAANMNRQAAETALAPKVLLPVKEHKLRQHLEEEVKNRIRFIGVSAHELKGPLTPIITSSGILREILPLISIKDEGLGISPEDQAVLFQSYQRAGQDLQKVQGLGLGLTVVKAIVEAHGGRIWVESEPGKGSLLVSVSL